MKYALRCFECRQTFDDPDDTYTCPECNTNNVSTWTWEPNDPFEAVERRRDAIAQLCLRIDSGTDTGWTFEYKHLYGRMEFMPQPVVVIWGHTTTSSESPRTMDLQSAKEYVAMRQPLPDTKTEEASGAKADWRIVDVE